MYDTINLWLPIDKANGFDVNKTMQHLSNITEHSRNDGQNYVSGYLDNYKVNISEQGISLKGSLAKYFLPDNLCSLCFYLWGDRWTLQHDNLFFLKFHPHQH